MAHVQFKIISQNVRGIRDKNKRTKCFERMKERGDICFLQETHSTEIDVLHWNNEWNGNVFYSHGSSNSKGVIILVRQSLEFNCLDIVSDSNGRYILMKCEVQGQTFMLCNIYAPTHEKEHSIFLEKLKAEIITLCHGNDYPCLFGGDLNFVTDISLDRDGGNPHLWNKSVAEWHDICDLFDIIDIWRTRNPILRKYTWRRRKPSLIQSRIDRIYVSDVLQPHVTKVDIIPGIGSDHSAVVIEINNNTQMSQGSSYWKFNNSFLIDDNFVDDMKSYIDHIWNESEELVWLRCRWDYLKYKMKEKSREFGISRAKRRRQRIFGLEKEIKVLEQSRLETSVARCDELKRELDMIYQERVDHLATQAKCDVYEHNERNTKYFLNIIKRNKNKSTIRKLSTDDKTIDKTDDIMSSIKHFYSDLYACKDTNENITSHFAHVLFNNASIPVLDEHEQILCSYDLTEEELKLCLDKMAKKKTPGNDGLSVEFFQHFWAQLSNKLLGVFNEIVTHGEMSKSQKQSVIVLIEKNGKDKLLLTNWRPISLINVDTKLFSRCLAIRMKTVLPKLIHESQCAYVSGRFLGEGAMLIDEIIQYVETCNLPVLLLAIDFKKAFDSLSWSFLWKILEVFRFPEKFINMIKVLYCNIESCVMNNGVSTGYFPVRRGVKQGDPLSAYLFILAIEILAIHIRSNHDIKGVNFFGEEIKLSIYADDMTAFLTDTISAENLLMLLQKFAQVSGLKINLDKTEAMWLGSCKGRRYKPLGVKWKTCIKITGVYFTCDKLLKETMNYDIVIKKLETMCNIWRQRNLSYIGKIQVIKTYGVSLLNFVTNICPVPGWVYKSVNKILYSFLWNGKPDKIKRKSIVAPIENGGLKMPCIELIVKTQRVMWMKRFVCSAYHPWKRFLSHYLNKLGGLYILNGNLHADSTKQFPMFVKELLTACVEYFNMDDPGVLNQCIWWNKDICTGNGKPLKPNSELQVLGINRVIDVYDKERGHIFTWDELLRKGWKPRMFIFWCSILSSLPQAWKSIRNVDTYREREYDDILASLNSKKVYDIFIKNHTEPPVSESKLNQMFHLQSHNWQDTYLLPFKTTIDIKLRVLQFKITHNICYSNKRLYDMKMCATDKCQRCLLEVETLQHMFCDCSFVKEFWSYVNRRYLNVLLNNVDLSAVQIIFGDPNLTINKDITNHLILIAKQFIYESRVNNTPIIYTLFDRKVETICKLEKMIAVRNNSLVVFERKWNALYEP